jgi:hypothetical protein
MNLYKLETWATKKFDSKLLSLHDFIGSFHYHPHPHPTSPQKIGCLIEYEEENFGLDSWFASEEKVFGFFF